MSHIEFAKQAAIAASLFAQRPHAAGLTKAATTALVRQILRGTLSPSSITRAATAMRPGTVRQVKNLGHGSFNLADLMVGNVGGKPGLSVRKLPLRATSLERENRLSRLASGRIEQMQPGVVAKHIPTDGRKGVFQEYGTKQVVPGWTPEASRQGKYFQGHIQSHADASRFYENLVSKGVNDIRPSNLGPGGQLIDYQLRVGNKHRLLAGETRGPELSRSAAFQKNMPAIRVAKRPQGWRDLPAPQKADIEKQFQEARRVQDADWAKYHKLTEQRLPNFVRKYWLAGGPKPDLTPTYAKEVAVNLVPTATATSGRQTLATYATDAAAYLRKLLSRILYRKTA
jgi:hypothetical protein